MIEMLRRGFSARLPRSLTGVFKGLSYGGKMKKREPNKMGLRAMTRSDIAGTLSRREFNHATGFGGCDLQFINDVQKTSS